VLDFGVIKEKLCMWTEDYWDHRMLIWDQDPYLQSLIDLSPGSIVITPFNPTAENMASYLLDKGVELLEGTGVRLTRVHVEETRKCSAEASL
jgi:6-pyruvoyltetrahydropterin/6-carboxytetrahydropterin synthase